LNGIPPVVSDRGGLPEIAGGGGFVRPIPPEAVARPREPVGPGAVEPWVELLLRLTDDEGFYEASAARAAGAGRAFHPDNLIPRYAEFFRSVAARPSTFR
ncbi:MAG TPA: hypothetical protein VHM90_03540, partial [Phycisphaerae bacterium]|nr:hypothetical protein [Phycisphaerae bacterium]